LSTFGTQTSCFFCGFPGVFQNSSTSSQRPGQSHNQIPMRQTLGTRFPITAM
jgi:hypothetical protein